MSTLLYILAVFHGINAIVFLMMHLHNRYNTVVGSVFGTLFAGAFLVTAVVLWKAASNPTFL